MRAFPLFISQRRLKDRASIVEVKRGSERLIISPPPHPSIFLQYIRYHDSLLQPFLPFERTHVYLSSSPFALKSKEPVDRFGLYILACGISQLRDDGVAMLFCGIYPGSFSHCISAEPRGLVQQKRRPALYCLDSNFFFPRPGSWRLMWKNNTGEKRSGAYMCYIVRSRGQASVLFVRASAAADNLETD